VEIRQKGMYDVTDNGGTVLMKLHERICNVDGINIVKDVSAEPDTMDIDTLILNFKGVVKGERKRKRKIMLYRRKTKCRVKKYRPAVKSLKELQEFAVQRNDSNTLSVISQAKVLVKIRVAKSVNRVQKLYLSSSKITKTHYSSFFYSV
jgi:hypothetical protein